MRGRKARSVSPTKSVVGYVRVSTEDQARGGTSLAAQRARIEAYAVAAARELHEVVEDAGESAKTLARPGIMRVLAGVRSGSIGTVIVIKLDRLTRSVKDLADLLEIFANESATIVSVGESLDTSSAAGRMVTNMLGVVAQWEREAIAERTSAALGQRRREGLVYSRPPFGFIRDGNRLLPDPLQQRGLEMIREMYFADASLRQIARALSDAGIPPARGGKWFASSIKSIVGSRAFEVHGSSA